ncbi:MAG TPA: response regulator [Terriglobia bacterium]|nr:response regulator [Terriglobia bacterium]
MNSKNPVNILLVDDQPSKLLSYEAILADLQENLIKARSGREALEHLLRSDIAVVLVDVCMPDLDGFELASMIRSHPRFQKTAIILVSGVLVEDVDRLKGYDSGAVDYVSVPIVPEILRAKVAVFADLFRKTEDLERLNRELERRVAERTAQIEASAALLRQSEERLRIALTAGGIQAWTWDFLTREFSWVRDAGDSAPVFESFADFLALVHPADRAVVQHAFRQAVDGNGEYQAEFRTQQSGDDQWWLAHGTVIRDSSANPLSIAGVNINITARKHAEEERVVLLKNAQDARRELEKANRLKDEFLATLSHELRTPLNAITGWAHLLREGGLDPAAQIKAIETINSNAVLQARLISDLLDVSRIVSGRLRLDLRPVNLPSVVHAALDTIRPTAEAKNIQIDAVLMPDGQPVSGDPARLQQVVSNLLSNAVKFTPANGHVQIRLEQVGSNLELTVQDDGPGIRPDFLPYIFDPFRQGDASSARVHQGLGLGLAIVRHLLEMHGGQIQALNREDSSGAIFKVVLPSSTSAVETLGGTPEAYPLPPEGVTRRDSDSLLEGVRVLVVEDEADSREVVALILERSGAEVMVAAAASEALRILESELPDVLVADIEMPGEDGYSLVQRVRALPSERGGHTPAVALTAHAAALDRAKLLGAGFDRHVPKPVQPPELVTVVAALARIRGRAAGRPAVQAANKVVSVGRGPGS